MATDTATTEATERPGRERSFAFWLGVVTLGALLLRIAYVIWYEQTHYGPGGDAFFYHFEANAIGNGHWFIEPLQFECFDMKLQTAAHPPLYPLFLSVFSVFGGETTLIHRLATAFLGAGTVWFVGSAGREMHSEKVGIVAAIVAAIYPALWVNDGLLMSETMFAFTIALLVWLSFRYLNRPSRGGAAWIGFALALTVLTRAEAIVLALLLAMPLFLRYPRGGVLAFKERFLRLGLAGLVTVVTLSPLIVHNMARFEEPVYVSTGLGSVLGVANCETTYEGKFLGLWSPNCVLEIDNVAAGRDADARPVLRAAPVAGSYCLRYDDGRDLGDESEVEHLRREESLDFIGDNLDRLPAVIAARLGRTFEVFRPTQGITYGDFVENRGKVASYAGQWAFYLYALLAIAGAVILHRQRRPLLPCTAMLAVVVITTIVTYGNVRFRIPLDVVLPLLVAVAVVAFLSSRAKQPMPPPSGLARSGERRPETNDALRKRARPESEKQPLPPSSALASTAPAPPGVDGEGSASSAR